MIKSDQFPFLCPYCSARLWSKPSQVGEIKSCLTCKRSYEIPSPDAPKSADTEFVAGLKLQPIQEQVELLRVQLEELVKVRQMLEAERADVNPRFGRLLVSLSVILLGGQLLVVGEEGYFYRSIIVACFWVLLIFGLAKQYSAKESLGEKPRKR